MTRQLGQGIDKILSMHIWENSLAGVHFRIIRHFNILYYISYHSIIQIILVVVMKDSKIPL